MAWNPWTDLRDRDDIASLNLPVPFGPMPANTSKQIIQNYNAAVSYVDDLIGQLLRKIDKNTIVVLVGDHGNFILLNPASIVIKISHLIIY